MTEYTYTDADWRENAKYGLVGVTADDATEHWDRWLAAHDAALVEKLIADVNESPAVTWAGHGGVKERLRARAAELREDAK